MSVMLKIVSTFKLAATLVYFFNPRQEREKANKEETLPFLQLSSVCPLPPTYM